MEQEALVVQGGTLIDGTGRPPIENAVIVIEQGRFKAVGREGEIAVPPGAEVIDAAGRTVLPGYIDGHGHLEDFQGELYLHLGITTVATINIFQDGPWTGAQKRGQALGKIRGPRIWMAGRALGASAARPMSTACGTRASTAAISCCALPKRRGARCGASRSAAATSSS